MDKFWYIATYGIPLIGVVICILAGKFLYTLTKKRRIGRSTALLFYIICTLSPVFLAYLTLRFNNYPGSVLYGEASWALVTYAVAYLLFTCICIIVFWNEILSIPDHVKTTANDNKII